MAPTLPGAMDWWARMRPDAAAVVLAGDRLGYRDYRLWSNRVAVLSMAVIEALREGAAVTPRHDPSPDAPVVIIATSGSTARAKGVVFTNRSMTAYAASWSVEEPQAAVDARIISLAPLNTPAGCVQLMHYTCLGCTVFMEPRPIPSSARPRWWSVTAPPKSM